MQRQRRQAAAVARSIGVRHCFLPTQEFARPQYTRNAGDRCYFCKTELYARIEHWVGEQSAAETSSLPDAWTEPGGLAIVVNGANLDDLGDHRPGLLAAGENQIRSPLAECGFSKNDVRTVAKSWSLDVWDAPASPCLASRVAYGEEVTAARMTMIDQAEQRCSIWGSARSACDITEGITPESKSPWRICSVSPARQCGNRRFKLSSGPAFVILASTCKGSVPATSTNCCRWTTIGNPEHQPSRSPVDRHAQRQSSPSNIDESGAAVEPDLSGRTLGDYQLIRQLGAGGMSNVYLAEQLSLRRKVALKVLKRRLSQDASYVRRFHARRKRPRSWCTPTSCRFTKSGSRRRSTIIAQEYVPGRNLKQVLDRDGVAESSAGREHHAAGRWRR